MNMRSTPESTVYARDASASREQLERMGASPVFERAGRMYPLLKYLFDAALNDGGDRLNQYSIATEVLGRDDEFDPSSDSIVRVEIGRLRNKLREYYEADGRMDRVRFELPKGGYRLQITNLEAASGSRATNIPTAVTLTLALVAIVLVGVAGFGFVERGSVTHDDYVARAGETLAGDSPAESQAVPATELQLPTDSPEAWDRFVRVPTVSPVERIELLDQAIEFDPDFAEAHAIKAYLLAYGQINSPFGTAMKLPGENPGQAIVWHAQRAIELDPDVPDARIALGSHYLFTYRWTKARQAFEEAERVRPSEGRLLNYVYLDAFSGSEEEALRIVDRLIRNNPEASVPLRSIRGLVLALAGDFDAAAHSLRAGISGARQPLNEGQIQSMLVERGWLAAVEIARGETDAALDELRLIEKLQVETRDSELPFMAYAYARLGRHEDSQRILAELEPLMKGPGPFGSGAWALVHLAKGDAAGAFQALEDAAHKASRLEPDEHFFALMLLRANVLADPILERPAFADMLSQIAGN